MQPTRAGTAASSASDHDHDRLLPENAGLASSHFEDDDDDDDGQSSAHLSSLVQSLDRSRARHRTCFRPQSNRFVFFGWFLTIGYYYSSRFKILESLDIPWAISFIQGVICLPLLLAACLFRQKWVPLKVDRGDLFVLAPLAVAHTLCHLAVLDINARTPSTLYFYEAVRVTEPFFTAIIAKHFLNEEYSKRDYTYLSLFVLSLEIGGFYFVQYRSSMLFFALIVTLASSLRSVLALRALRTLPRFSNVSDLYFVTTLISTALVSGLTIIVDGCNKFHDLQNFIQMLIGEHHHQSSARILLWMFLCGICFFVKNYLTFCFLSFCDSAVKHCFGTTFLSFLGRRFALLSPFLFFIPILALPELIGSLFASLAIWLFLRHQKSVEKQRRRHQHPGPPWLGSALFATSAVELRSRVTRHTH